MDLFMVTKWNRKNTGIQLDRREECSYDRLVLRRSVYYSHTTILEGSAGGVLR